MAETLAVRQKRKATRRGRDDSENACFTVATKDFTSWLLFSRNARARAQEWTASFYERTQGQSCRDSFLFSSKWNLSEKRKNAASFPFSYRLRPFRTMLHQLTRCNLSDLYVSSIRIWHKRIFFWLHHEWNNISPFHKCF